MFILTLELFYLSIILGGKLKNQILVSTKLLFCLFVTVNLITTFNIRLSNLTNTFLQQITYVKESIKVLILLN